MFELRRGVNYAVPGATALDFAFHAARGVNNPMTNSSLRVQLGWFKYSLSFLCANVPGISSLGFSEAAEPSVGKSVLAPALHVVISKEKSLISRSGSAEFAKNFRVRDLTVDLSPVSIKALLNTFHPYGLMAVAHRYSLGNGGGGVVSGGGGGGGGGTVIVVGGEADAAGSNSLLKPSNWKTRICNKWEQTGYCPFGSKCHFAHGDAGLMRVHNETISGDMF
ncbi:zinc finger CCCH domain-containing protein 56 [Tanacetum coccineum]